jgi:hypothetical protein
VETIGQKDGWMGEACCAVVVVVVVGQAFDAVGLSARLSLGVIFMGACACGILFHREYVDCIIGSSFV